MQNPNQKLHVNGWLLYKVFALLTFLDLHLFVACCTQLDQLCTDYRSGNLTASAAAADSLRRDRRLMSDESSIPVSAVCNSFTGEGPQQYTCTGAWGMCRCQDLTAASAAVHHGNMHSKSNVTVGNSAANFTAATTSCNKLCSNAWRGQEW